MKLTVAVAVAATSLLVIGVTGCTSAPVSAPKHVTAAQKCTPTTAKVQWQWPIDGVDMSNPNDANYVPVNATLLDYSAGDGSAVITQHYLAPKTTVNFDDPTDVLYRTGAKLSRWNAALLQSVRLSGQVPTDFGHREKFYDNQVSVDTKTGKFLNVDTEYLVSESFEIECAGVKPIDGTVSGVIPGAFRGILVGCNQKVHRHSMAEVRRALALTKTYCTSSGA